MKKLHFSSSLSSPLYTSKKETFSFNHPDYLHLFHIKCTFIGINGWWSCIEFICVV